MHRPPRRLAAVVLATAAAVLAWVAFAPAALGGPLTYAVIHGTSMEPRLHQGDLVLLRPAGGYDPGQVVGYHDPLLKRLVLHRIVGNDGTRFITKGDNNNFRDQTTPEPGQVVGRLWLRIPHAGGLISAIHSPIPAALLLGFVALAPFGESRRRRRHEPESGSRPDGAGHSHDARRAAIAVCLAAGCALAVLGVFAYGRPTTASAPIADAYRQSGRFSYRAASRPGATYPDGVVRTGQAVFPALSREIRITFAYRFSSLEESEVSGRGALDLVVSDGNGWKRRVALVPERAFDGARAALTANIPLARLREIISGMERETGTSQPEYSVVVRSGVSVSGAVGGAPVRAHLAQLLTFRLDASRLALAPAADGGPATLTTAQDGTIVRAHEGTLSILGRQLSVQQLRGLGLFGAEAAFAAAILLALPLLRALRGTESERMRCRLGSRLIDVQELPSTPPSGAVRVNGIAPLLRIADREEAPILVATRGARSHYGVLSRGILYCYSTGSASDTVASAEVAR